ncbi:unnamed protein product [Symbiodinium sp. CCMP2592]|nr:unnamed protein product [Symbiodinium sp. CCMP2592]
MACAGTFATILLGLCIIGCAVRPSREAVQQLLETEVAPPDVRPIAEAGTAFLEGDSAAYSHCDGLPRNGSHVINKTRFFSTSCTWHGQPGLQVTLKEPLTFQGNLVLTGEIQIMGEQELEGPCITVRGEMTVIAANASFVGCRNRMEDEALSWDARSGQDGEGGALRIQKDFIVSNSSVMFESCSASKGHGVNALIEDCAVSLTAEGPWLMLELPWADRGGVMEHTSGGLSITHGGKVHHGGSLAFKACNASSIGGGIYMDAGKGQFRKLLLDRCDADMTAAALAAIAANGAEAEVRIEELSLSRGSEGNVNDIAVAGLLKLDSANLSTESSSGIYISAHNLSLEDVMNCTSTSTCTFFANAARSSTFLCPLGTGSVDFEELRDFGCLACRPGDAQVLNMTKRPCSQCPEGASKCLASELKMEPGLMVELENVNGSFHCPNEAGKIRDPFKDFMTL